MHRDLEAAELKLDYFYIYAEIHVNIFSLPTPSLPCLLIYFLSIRTSKTLRLLSDRLQLFSFLFLLLPSLYSQLSPSRSSQFSSTVLLTFKNVLIGPYLARNVLRNLGGCWSHPEERARVLGSRDRRLKIIFWPKTEDVTWVWRKLGN